MSRKQPVDESYFLRKRRRGAMQGFQHYITQVAVEGGASGYVMRLDSTLVGEDQAHPSISRSDAKRAGRLWLAANGHRGKITPVPVEQGT